VVSNVLVVVHSRQTDTWSNSDLELGLMFACWWYHKKNFDCVISSELQQSRSWTSYPFDVLYHYISRSFFFKICTNQPPVSITSFHLLIILILLLGYASRRHNTPLERPISCTRKAKLFIIIALKKYQLSHLANSVINFAFLATSVQ